MNSCELPGATAPDDSARVTELGSRVHRFVSGAAHSWTGVPIQQYKAAADHHCGVNRSVLVGEGSEKTTFAVRYFEIAPGGFSTLESHRHEHVVLVFRGTGRVRLADVWQEVLVGDVVYVAPNETHQLRNEGVEPFGFFCVVDRVRDVPVPACG